MLERRLTDPGSHVHVPNGMHRPSTPTEEDRLLLSTTFLGTVLAAVDGDQRTAVHLAAKAGHAHRRHAARRRGGA